MNKNDTTASPPAPARDWTFFNPVRIRFGEDSIARAAAANTSRRMLLVTSAGMIRRGIAATVTNTWTGVDWHTCDTVQPNPELDFLEQLAASLRREKPFDAILCLGGGSAMDTGKVLSVLLGQSTGPGFNLRKHLAQTGAGMANLTPLPVVAVPTTSGTGSEVTPFATIWNTPDNKKHSLADAKMFPREALLAPSLTHNLPWDVTLAAALDALCQGLEALWNRNANPLTMHMATQAAKLAWDTLRRGREILRSPALRSDMMRASLMAGIAISQTRTALCHSISYPVTLAFGVPHGLACAFVMPAVCAHNLPADDGRLERFAATMGLPAARDLPEALMTLLASLGVPDVVGARIRDLERLYSLSGDMITPGRADNNLREAPPAEIETLLRAHMPSFLSRAGGCERK